MSANLFSFDNDGFPILNTYDLSKLTLTDKKEKHVICLIGQARMGKSFFLNCFNAYLKNISPYPERYKTDDIFDSKVGDNHCTKGINVYESDEYIFIDCQGLKYEDSKGDDKLLLIAYTLSDVVIINGIKTLDNTMFSFIEPISVFENHLKQSKPKMHKPTLVFKIMDYQMDDEPDEKIVSQLKKLMAKSKDNYQTLRNTLGLLFDKTTHAIYTLPPDRSEKKYLKENNYKYALESNDLHFTESIESIIVICNGLNHKSKVTQEQFLDKCEILSDEMERLKTKKSFDIQESDLSKLLGEQRCKVFCDEIMQEMTVDNDGNKIKNPNRTVVDEFKVAKTGNVKEILQRDTIEQETKKIMNMLNEFDEQFKDADPNFVVQHFHKLCEHLFSSIIPKLKINKQMTDDKIKTINVSHIVKDFFQKHNQKIQNYEKYYSPLDDFQILHSQISIYYGKQMNEYINSTLIFMPQKNEYGDTIIKKMLKKSPLINTFKICENIDEQHIDDKKISELLCEFAELYNYDANDTLCKISNELHELCEIYENIINNNMKNIKTNNTQLASIYGNIVSVEFICKHMKMRNGSNKFETNKNFIINLVEPLKNHLKISLREAEDNLEIITLGELDIDFVNVHCKYELVNVTQNKNSGKQNNITNMFFPQNAWSKYYDMLTIDFFTSSSQIMYSYKNKMSEYIKKDIEDNSLTYNQSIEIINANPEIEFICFVNSNVFLHNLVRNHFVPNDGHLLIQNNTSLNKTLGDYKLSDIMDIYDADEKINITFVNEFTSQNELEMVRLQNNIAVHKSKFHKITSTKNEYIDDDNSEYMSGEEDDDEDDNEKTIKITKNKSYSEKLFLVT